MQDYIIEPLSRSTIISAYPLIRLSSPGVGLPAWKQQAKAAIDGRKRGNKGILVARRASRQYICGMVWYHSEFDLTQGMVLQATNLLAVDILDPPAIMLKLILALGPIARSNGCKRVKIIVPDSQIASAVVTHAVGPFGHDPAIEYCIEVDFSP